MGPVSIPRKVPFARNKNSNVFAKFVKSKMTCITFTPCPGKTINESHLYNLLNIEKIMSFNIKKVSIACAQPFILGKMSKECGKSVEFYMTCITFTPCPENTIQGSLLCFLLYIEEIMSFLLKQVSIASDEPFVLRKISMVCGKFVELKIS